MRNSSPWGFDIRRGVNALLRRTPFLLQRAFDNDRVIHICFPNENGGSGREWIASFLIACLINNCSNDRIA